MKIVPGNIVQLCSGGAPFTVVSVKTSFGARTLGLAAMSAGGLLQVIEGVECQAVTVYIGPRTPSSKETDARGLHPYSNGRSGFRD